METNIANVSYASIVLIALSTIPPLFRLAKRPWRINRTNEPELYEDEDGVATPESMSRFSVKKHFIAIFAVVALGLAVSFAGAVFGSVRLRSHEFLGNLLITQLWLLFPAWVCGLFYIGKDEC